MYLYSDLLGYILYIIIRSILLKREPKLYTLMPSLGQTRYRERSHHTQKSPWGPLMIHSLLSGGSQATTDLEFLTADKFTFSRILNKWYPVAYTLLCLASFTAVITLRSVHGVVCIDRTHSFTVSNSISFCGYNPFYLSTLLLDCYQLLTTGNKTTINLCAQVSVWTYVWVSPGQTLLGVKCVGHLVGLTLIF